MADGLYMRGLHSVSLRLVRGATLEDGTRLGEWRLLVAILDRAVKDVAEDSPRERELAMAWVAGKIDAPFTFQDLCDYLGIDVGWARRVFEALSAVASQDRLAA